MNNIKDDSRFRILIHSLEFESGEYDNIFEFKIIWSGYKSFSLLMETKKGKKRIEST